MPGHAGQAEVGHRACRGADGSRGRGGPGLADRHQPAPELEGEGEQHHAGGEGQPDGRVEGVGPDRPPAIGVEQGAPQHGALEDGGHHRGVLGVGGVGPGDGARLVIGGHRAEVDLDVVVGPGLGLGAGGHLETGVLVHGGGVGRGQGLDGGAVVGREGDVLAASWVVTELWVKPAAQKANPATKPRMRTSPAGRTRTRQRRALVMVWFLPVRGGGQVVCLHAGGRPQAGPGPAVISPNDRRP